MTDETPGRDNADLGAAGDAPPAAPPGRIPRVVLIVLGLAAWFGTQALIARRDFPEQGIGDALLAWTGGLHASLRSHPAAARALLIASSAVIDALGLFLLARAVFGPTIRPFLGLLVVFALRQVCQGLCSLPMPEGMIWEYPGFPSLLVTYGTSTDLFFSGHTAIAVYGATELARLRGRGWVALGALIAVFEMAAVIVLRAHYTMDVFTGLVAALWAAGIVDRLAPHADRWLARFGRRG